MNIQDPASVAISPSQGVMATVKVSTHEGDDYVFPSMNVTALKAVLPDSGRRPENMPALVMVNANMATITIPFRIIDKVYIAEEEVWSA